MITLPGIESNMIANNLHPAQPTHPGEIIKDEIDYLGISQKDLSENTGISYSIINEIIHGKRQVSVEYAMLLEAALNIDADMLINMQQNFNKEMALRNTPFMERLKSIRKIASSVVL